MFKRILIPYIENYLASFINLSYVHFWVICLFQETMHFALLRFIFFNANT